MKLLFLMRNLMYLRNFEGTLRQLALHGHQIVIAYEDAREKAPEDIRQAAHRLVADCPSVELCIVPVRADRWAMLAQQARVLRHHTRYQHPRYAKATRCAERAASSVHPMLRRLAFAWCKDPLERAEKLSALTRYIEAALPEDPAIAGVIERIAPDLVLVTPLIDFGSTQVDYLKAANRRGVPTCLCVASWDNLTNKGLIPIMPDRVFVWNADQAHEAEMLHGVPHERIVVTGAQLFDDWFDRQPSKEREAFCREAGLDPARPFLLYTCSSIFISRLESSFLLRWLSALRASPDPLLCDIGVLIRPHPGSTKHAAQWNDPRIAAFDNVTVQPTTGGYPVTEENRQFYFDSIYHAVAVVGINTSAMLEAAIIGRPCFTVRDAETEPAQEGMLHFTYLTRYGFVRPAHGMVGHLAQLAESLRGGPPGTAPAESVRAFLRPHGLKTPATPILVEAIEGVVGLAPQPLGLPQPRPATQTALRPVAWVFGLLAAQRTGKKWVSQHPTAQRWARLMLPAHSGFSGNVWFRLRRAQRRGYRFARIVVYLPRDLAVHRSLDAAKKAATARIHLPKRIVDSDRR